MADILLVIGVLLSSCTQLRVSGLPLGPGELCLLGWLSISVGVCFSQQVRAPAFVIPVVVFAGLLALSESVGLIAGLAIELYYDVPAILHDIFAYTFLIFAAVMMGQSLIVDVRRRKLAWLFASGGTVGLLLQLAHGQGLISLPGVDPWHFDRFRGWSNDPNQLSFLATVLVFLGLWIMQGADQLLTRLLALFFVFVAAVAGLLTKSDTFVVSVAVALLVFFGLNVRNWLSEPCPSARSGIVCIVVVCSPLAFLSLAPLFPVIATFSDEASEQMYNQDGQGDTRLSLWSEALAKSLESGMVGFGPGPHLTSKSYKRPPPDKFESHNTPLELLTQGGFLASFSFLGLLGFTLWRTASNGQPALCGLVCAYLVFSMFHFVLRHPIFWFGLMFCLAASARSPAVFFEVGFANALRRRWKTVAVACLCGGVLGLVAGAAQPLRFTAKAQVLYKPVDDKARASLFEANVETYVQLLTSAEHVRQLRDELAESTVLVPSDQSMSKGGAIWAMSFPLVELSQRLHAYKEAGSQVIAVTFTARDPDDAALVANSSVNLFLKTLERGKRQADAALATDTFQRLQTKRAEADVLAADLVVHAGSAGDIAGPLIEIGQEIASVRRRLAEDELKPGRAISVAGTSGEFDPALVDGQRKLQLQQRLRILQDAYVRLSYDSGADATRKLEMDAADRQYNYLLFLNAERSVKDAEPLDLHLVAKALPPDKPSSAAPMLYVAPGLLLGLILASVWIMILEKMDVGARFPQKIQAGSTSWRRSKAPRESSRIDA